MAVGTKQAVVGAMGARQPGVALTFNRLWLLVLPALAIFLVFFVIPVLLMLAIAFNPPKPGVVKFEPTLTLANFSRWLGNSLYTNAAITSITLALVVVVITLILAYPLAYLVAKTKSPRRTSFYMILILISMQLDLVIRMYGLMVLMGDNGLINASLMQWHVISSPLPLMYNAFGTVVGLVQMSLPFMILSLIGVIQSIQPVFEEAARSLGASRWSTFWHITFPLSMPGVLAGSLLVFAIAISSYVVPALIGGWRVLVMPINIYTQISEQGNWQFGSTIAVILFAISLAAVYAYHRYTEKRIGGLV
jgi:putative spermidine/putrescine transport system permease protein